MKFNYKKLLQVTLREGIKYLMFLIAFILISILLLTQCSGVMNAIDNAFINFNKNVLENSLLTSIMTAITYLGSYGSYIFLVVISFIVLRKKILIPTFMMCAVGGSGVLNKIVKAFIKRPRSETALIAIPDSYSFPSGHTMCSVVFYMYLIHLVNVYVTDKTLKNILRVVLTLIPIAIGYSRIYLGVHYATDVIAGAIIGVVTYFPFIKITNAIKEGFEK